MSGDFWGAADDDFYAIPENITTVVDVSLSLNYTPILCSLYHFRKLLEDGGNSGGKNLSWACYSENLP